MNKFKVHSFSILLIFTISVNAYAQDLEQVGKKGGIKLNGNINATNIFYAQQGLLKNRRDPSMWMISGGLTFSAYGWSAPFTFSFSQNNKSFQQPFNQYGISPKYKWLTLHAGYRNLSFSPYTLAGHTFFGGGAEATPGNWKFGAMVGRMLKAVKEDTLTTQLNTPSFQRLGYGMKAGYEKDGKGIESTMFYAKDQLGSLPYVPVATEVLPAENFVWNVAGKYRLSKQLSIQAEYANSIFTRDIRSQGIVNDPGFPIQRKESTGIYDAYKASATYSLKRINFQGNYERVNPGYRSLGAYFFTSDIENVTFNTSTKLNKDKLGISFNIGTQRNNLKKTETTTIRRIIGSINFTYAPSQKWNFTAAYSNFMTNTAIESRIKQYQSQDSLRFYQVSQTANGSATWSGGTKERKKSISLSLNYQKAKNDQIGIVTSSDFYNSNLAYRFANAPRAFSWSLGVNTNYNTVGEKNNLILGPVFSMTKTFKKKLRSTLSSGYNTIFTDGVNNSKLLNMSFNNSITVKKRHSFSFNNVVIHRGKTVVGNQAAFTEWTGTVVYGWSF